MRRGWYHTVGGAAAPWTPASFGADLALWLDASVGVTESGGAVSAWEDQSGKGNHATQGTAGARPTYSATGLNGKPALSFDGGDRLALTFVPWSGAQARSLFIVYKPLATAGNNYVFFTGTTSTGQAFGILSQAANDPYFAGWSADLASGIARSTAALLAEASYSGSVVRLAKNNGSYAAASRSLNTSTFAAVVGDRTNGAEPFDGHIAEIIATSRQLTAEEVTQVRSYINAKYALW